MKRIAAVTAMTIGTLAGFNAPDAAALEPDTSRIRGVGPTHSEGFPDLLSCDQIDQDNATVWVVDAEDPDADFTEIQAAVDEAHPGDYILVGPGVYVENLKVLNNDVNIIGCEGSAETIINPLRGTAVYLAGISRSFLFQGFTITGGVSGPTAGLGGGLHMDGGFGILRDLQIVGNRSATNGGGVFLRGASPDMKYVDIFDNSAAADGGGLYLTQAAAFMSTMRIEGNTAEGNGGGIYNFVGAPIMQYVDVEGNFAVNGGGIAAIDSSPLLVSGTIRGNGATGNGGGVFARAVGIPSGPSLVSTIIGDNSAGNRGGGIHADGALLLMEGSWLIANSAGFGGGAFVDGANYAILKNVVARGNYAEYDGGGMALTRGTYGSLTNLKFTGNDADRYGGGLFVSGQRLLLSNGIFAGNVALAGAGVYSYVAEVGMSNLVLVSNNAQGGLGGGFYLNEPTGGVIANSVFAYNRGGAGRENLYANSSSFVTTHSVFFADGLAGVDGIELSETDQVISPAFINAPSDGLIADDDYHLQADSPLINAGVEERWMEDPDGSRADIGAYGGLYADQWDLDSDDYMQWWDPTMGLDPETDDCDDEDISMNPEAGCDQP